MKKIKLESSEEIADIVRAIQKGEEPEEYLKKKKAEQREAEEKRLAAERAAREEKEAAERAAREEKEAAERARREKEEAAKRAAREEEEAARAAAAQERRASAKAFIAEKTGEIKERIIREKPSGESDRKDTDEKSGESADKEAENNIVSEGRAENKIKRRYGSKSVSDEADKVGKQILRSLHMEMNEAESSHDNIQEETEIQPDEDQSVKVQDAEVQSAEDQDLNEQDTKTQSAGDQSLNEQDTKMQSAEDQSLKEENTEEEHTEAQFTDSQHTEKRRGKLWILFPVIGIIIAALIVTAVIFAVNYTNQIKEKRKYVTADTGLTVTVENQPEEWCSSCELDLKFSARKGKVSEIIVNGATYQTDKKGIITVEATEHYLNAEVRTEEDIFEAVIEIPKLDASAPVLSFSVSDDMVSLSAVDDYSDVDLILYAKVTEDDYIDLPVYQVYTEPFLNEEGVLYYFYAVDKAGNRSTPIVTTIVEAKSIEISQDEITIYSGQTMSVDANIVPSDAFMTEITYESSDTDVAVVDGYGNVTGLSDGSAVIKISAGNLPEAACTVKVISPQTVTISALGDVTLGSDRYSDTSNNLDAYYALNGPTYFFDNVRDVLEEDDLTFANLEGALTTSLTAKDKQFVFKGDPSYTEILQDASIEVVTLANNHSEDYGAEGLSDTKENLTGAGIEYCKEDIIAYEDVSGIKVAFIGIMELDYGMSCETTVRRTIAEAKSEGAQLIVVAFHWGTESSNEADEIQQYLAHVAIDCGADLVVGHHPHVLQGIEKYNGRYIVYSLGNFCFGGNTNPSDKDTIIFRQTFTIDQNGVADDDNIEIIPCRISSVSDYNNYQPVLADESQAEEIMERINEYSSAFGDITYTAATFY